MRRDSGYCLAVLLAVGALLPGEARAQSEGAEPLPDAATLRKRLDTMEQQRREAEANRPFLWEVNERPLDLGRKTEINRQSALVELRYEAAEIPCFVAFQRADKPDSRPVQAPMGLRGSQWLRLDPGKWNVRFVAGYATGPVLSYPPSEIEVKGGKVYRLTFGEDHERRVRGRARDEALEPARRNRASGVTVSPER
jgi:hypothetical protein